MNNKNKKPRVYKRITPRVVALHEAQEIISGNGTQAVRDTDIEYQAPEARAYRIVKKRQNESISEYIENGLQQIGESAVSKLSELVNSDDDNVALRATTYTIDHLRGKAVTRNISVTGKMNIQSVLD